MPLDVIELEPTTRNDYRRANGAPMVMVNGRNERYSRPSSFAKPLDDESALVNWRIDRGCIGVAHDRALQARWVAVTDDDREAKAKLRDDSISAGRGAERADIGTALHAMSVRFEQDLTFSPPQPYLESLQAYMDALQQLNLVSTHYEFHTVNRQYRCAGTADRLYRVCSPLVTPHGEILPVGTLLVGDLKTGEKLEYSKPAYAVQLALYASGEFYDVLLDDFIETPAINKNWAIIVHMPADEPGRCELLWVDLEVGHWGAYLVDQIKLWRKMWRSGEFAMPSVALATPAPPPPCDATIADGGGEAQPSADSQPQPPPPLLDAHIEWARERIAQIAEHPGAKAALMLRWPSGLPTPKQGIASLEQAESIHQLLDVIEADYQLGFVAKPSALLGTGPSTRKRKDKSNGTRTH